METYCPHCENQCPVDDLKCSNGREHFGVQEENRRKPGNQPARQEDRTIVLLRKCGHFLHHNVGRDGDTAALLTALSAEEKATLDTLLEKCLENWQGQQA